MKSATLHESAGAFHEKCRFSYERRRFPKDHLGGIVTLCFEL